ncbi:hypothetical protein AVEN_100523-1 [Araneus ventricosus]|uniref:Uncharacterized protein n=1 Tax=Araneus ventricosus TaxID=182803 RepID=A0A4Y2UJ12_ARAVE|nr:hypothetical protein AVEN_100523-1 [Araneus ventricosus]
MDFIVVEDFILNLHKQTMNLDTACSGNLHKQTMNLDTACSGFESKDSDFDSDHHAADVRRAYLGIIVNQLVAT